MKEGRETSGKGEEIKVHHVKKNRLIETMGMFLPQVCMHIRVCMHMHTGEKVVRQLVDLC